MYIPVAFAEVVSSKLHDFIEQHSFGVLVTQHEGASFASHLPFLLNRESGPHGTLIGHMARANPQWETAESQEALAIFSGPHAYVSPSWYEAEQVVPTWNYIAVHAYGRMQLVREPEALLGIVQSSVELFESTLPQPWGLAPNAFVQKLLSQIVGFRIEISCLEGKWKLNQNHSVERRQRVIRQLRKRPDDSSQAIADAMQAMLPEAVP